MLINFRVRNFKNLVDIGDNFKPQPLNVIIGPNGCGKSSLLQAIDFLRAFFMSSVEVYLKEKGWDFRDLPNLRQTGKTIEWTVTAKLEADESGVGGGLYEYSIQLSPKRYLGIGEEKLIYTAHDKHRETLLDRDGRRVQIENRKTGIKEESRLLRYPASIITGFDPVDDKAKYPELLHFRKWVEQFRYFLIWDPKILRRSDRGKHEELGPSGEHLAPLLGLLRQRSPAKFERFLKRIRRLFPNVTDISVTGGKTWGWHTIRLHERNGHQDISFNSQHMSDGVLRLLAVMNLLYLDHLPSLIMFEEPENGVHPQLVREVVQVLRELTQRKTPNRTQVILTTHSPYVLDEFYDHPEQVFVMERPQPQSGASLIQLSTASQIHTVNATFNKSLGEAWYSGMIGGTAKGSVK